MTIISLELPYYIKINMISTASNVIYDHSTNIPNFYCVLYGVRLIYTLK